MPSSSELPDYVIDGLHTEQFLVPESETQAAEIIYQSRQESLALVPWGGGTSIHQGNRLKATRWAALSSSAMTGLVDYSPDDMVVTARAGMTLAELQAILAPHNQFLPLDPPAAERATIGGIVATNAQGLLRPAFGAVRDRLLGVRVVLADGSVIKGGGKVVKNVAGYDLCKLFAGSWGTLGFIVEATFKTNPIPESRRFISYRTESLGQALEAALKLHTALLQPAYAVASNIKGNCLSIGLLGSNGAVEWQSSEIDRLLGLERSDTGPDEASLREAPAHWPISARAYLRPGDVPEFIKRLPPVSMVMAHVPSGIIELSLRQETMSQIAGLVPESGRLVWTQIPDAYRLHVDDVWGQPRADIAIMRKMKQALDPTNLFSPGRFIGGI